MIIDSASEQNVKNFLQQLHSNPASESMNGEVVAPKPLPDGEHSLLQTTLCEVINSITRSQKFALAFPELRCTFGGDCIIPDIAVFRWERIPLQASGRIAKLFEIHPDWVIEILSPQQRQAKVLSQLLNCSRNGTELSWLIDPEAETVVGVFSGQRVEVYEGASLLPMLSGVELELTVDQLFSWLSFG
ncbi:MAG: Uma2 family endonuclease [Nostocaceae cyanobacterium]|nr:Uma2 family endonuclease [Nostocaceae cyanobacterium]